MQNQDNMLIINKLRVYFNFKTHSQLLFLKLSVILHNYHFTLFKRCGDIDYPLVTATAVVQLVVHESLNETAVNKHINQFEQFPLCGVLNELFKEIARIAPDILVAPFLDGAGKCREALGLEHWVATREGNVGKRVGKYHLKNLLNLNFATVSDIPRLGVMTPWATVRTACTVYRSAEARTIDRSVLHNVEYGYSCHSITGNV